MLSSSFLGRIGGHRRWHSLGPFIRWIQYPEPLTLSRYRSKRPKESGLFVYWRKNRAIFALTVGTKRGDPCLLSWLPGGKKVSVLVKVPPEERCQSLQSPHNAHLRNNSLCILRNGKYWFSMNNTLNHHASLPKVGRIIKNSMPYLSEKLVRCD